MISFKYHSEHSDFFRTYYKNGKSLFCFQDDGKMSGGVQFYACTRDGEPSHRIDIPKNEQFDKLGKIKPDNFGVPYTDYYNSSHDSLFLPI